MSTQADIGLIGLAVMGQNLVLNMNDKGATVAVFNRTVSKVDDFLADGAKGRTTILGTHSLEELVGVLKKPRKIMLMVKAGEAVDQNITQLVPLLEKGDVIIDGGNSHFPDTERRTAELAEKGILYVGAGVSGGEEGARFGPSIMPGGNDKAWPLINDLFQGISAKTDSGEACCDWVGQGGAGHYVKMVHNGIEYGDIQLIAEAYHLLKAAGMDHKAMSRVFSEWNKGELDSYLIEIAASVLAHKDEDGSPLLEKILDTAGQKGTGKWTGMNSLELGVPVTLIAESVFARSISAMKGERTRASKIIQGPEKKFSGDLDAFAQDLGQALLASKIISYAQGFLLMHEASKEYGWKLNYGGIALMWRGGCIIRSVFLGKIKEAFDKEPGLDSLLTVPYFKDILVKAQDSWRRIVAGAITSGIPVPAMSSALSFFDGFRSEYLPANMIQALRDYFGAHTYERTDKPRGQFFHTNWTGTGGHVSSTTYNA